MRLRQRLRRTGVAVIAVVFLVLGASPARADVTDYLGQPIVSIRLVLDGRETTDPALSRVVDVHIGRPLAMRDIRETVLHLFALSRFDDVRVDASRQGTGVAIRFDMIGARPVSEIKFAGAVSAPGVDVGQLRRAVVDRAGPSPPFTRIDELSQVVETTLRTRGYLHAKVTGRSEPSGSSHSTLIFDLQPGPRATIGAINLAGPEDARPGFLEKLQMTPGMPFERDAVLARIDKYVASRRSQGYYEAKVDLADQVAADDRVNLTFTVNPGRHVRVVFTGDSFPGDRRELVPVEREGSVDEDLLEDSTARIEDALKSQGYKDAMAPHERTERNGELVITFRVSRGQPYRISRVTVDGNATVSFIELQPALRVREGTPLSQAALDAEAGAIEDVYRRLGFAAAKADIVITPQPPSDNQIPVLVAIKIREGTRTLVRSVKVTGNASITESTLLDGLRLQAGRPFVIASVAADSDAILVKYLNAGYENAAVEARPQRNREGTEADIVYAVREGPQVLVDHVLIVGPDRTDASIVEKQLRLHAGDPLSRDAVLDSQQRLRSLGLYRSVSISELRHGEENRRDLLVSVEEGPGTSVAYGGGFEVARRVVPSDSGTEAQEVLDAAPRGSFQISWRNLFGTNRSASVFSSLTLHPQGTEQGNRGVTEYRVLNTFREPKVFNTAIDGLITLTLEQQFRSSFSFRRRSATAEATRRLGGGVSLIGSYQLQQTNVYDVTADQNLIDLVFPNVRLSSFSLSVLRDTRNDQIDPTKGQYFSAYGQLAARALGGEVGFLKSFFRASTFHLLPRTRGIVLAGNGFLGLATGFPQIDSAGETVRDLPQSERFYAGGDTTMRGFAIDQLGIRHIPAQPAKDTIDENGFPLGGNSELLFNVELRVPVWKQIETHGFLDTGNVFKRAVDLDPGEFRTAVGFGILYKSPVGPLRFDLGFKVHPLPDESPTAFFITFGRAF
jgi:outer membrane protein insertion porin family